MQNELPFISIVIPCRNESAFIAEVLNNILNQDYENGKMEVWVVDGQSNDDTVAIVKSYTDKHPWIKLLSNPDMIVPFALNIAIRNSSGKFVVRMDAHTVYASDYVSKIVATFKQTNADIVGGPMRAVGKTDFQKAVAYATSTKLGVGDSQFHDENFEGYVDSVYLGAWKKEIFEGVGYFDEQMKRNQDDEFHYRAKSLGKKIYLNPKIKSTYYPRDSFSKLLKQYFQYGLFKPLVLKKVKSGMKLRHLIPTLFFIYLITLPVGYYLAGWVTLLPLLAYFALEVLFTLKSKGSINEKIFILLIYPILHFSYGCGFILGLFKM